MRRETSAKHRELPQVEHRTLQGGGTGAEPAIVGLDGELQHITALPWSFKSHCQGRGRLEVSVSGRFRATGEDRLRRPLESRTGRRPASTLADAEG